MNNKGFTLIELLIVIAIIGILAAAVLVAVDPVGRIQDARNARRWSEANGILNALLNKQVDDRALYVGTGSHPVVQHATLSQVIVSTETVGACSCAAAGVTLNTASAPNCWVNMSDISPNYIATVPLDANGGTAGNSGYYFRMGSNGRITVGSCNSEPGASGSAPAIQVTR